MADTMMGPGQETNQQRRMGQNYPQANGIQEAHWTEAGSVRGPLVEQDANVLHGRRMASIADPIPLGLAGFASATFTISSVNAGWFQSSPGDLAIAIGVALVFGGIGQFLAGMWAFARGNVLAATAFGTFGSFNAAFAVFLLLQLNHTIPTVSVGNPGNHAYVAGVFVLTFALIALYLGIAALGQNLWVAAILFTLALTYCFDGIAFFVSTSWVGIVGGYAGIVSSCLAFLLSAAIVINSAFRQERIPTFEVSPQAV